MIRFAAEQWLHGLWLVPVLGVLMALAIGRRRRAARRFVDTGLLALLAPGVNVTRPLIRAIFVLLALSAGVVALARPQWGTREEEVRTKGRDVCFMIDVSRSMLAEDLVPNRLERAKLWVKDALRAAQGDRVALVAFAGSSVVKCPLTLDYGFFNWALQDLSPASVTRGGTNIGDAMRLATSDVFSETEPSFKDIILITDGEDHDSFPVQAAEVAAKQGIRIIAVGIGDESVGTPIYVTDPSGRRQQVMYQGKPVLSKLDAETLKQMALATTGGKYLNVATGTIDLDTIYRQLVREAVQRETTERQAERYIDRFQLFIAASFACLLCATFIPERGRIRA